MTREELLQALTGIGTIEDPAERRSKITAIHDEVKGLYDTNETLTASNTKLEEDKKKLQDYNMELYLKVGNPKPTQQKQQTQTQEEDLKYENLFDEKGELK